MSRNIANVESIKFQCAIANEQSLNLQYVFAISVKGFRVLFGILVKTIRNIQTGVLVMNLLF